MSGLSTYTFHDGCHPAPVLNLALEKIMNKYFGKIIIGSALCASSMAFAGESASTTMVLSEQQMDSVTAGGSHTSSHPSFSSFTVQSISQRQGDSTNVNISPTVGLNVAVLTLGGNQSVRGGNTYQSGGTQIAYIGGH
jgi:hypothetical protein